MRKRKRKEIKGICLWCKEPMTYRLLVKQEGKYDKSWGFCDRHALDYAVKIMNEVEE